MICACVLKRCKVGTREGSYSDEVYTCCDEFCCWEDGRYTIFKENLGICVDRVIWTTVYVSRGAFCGRCELHTAMVE